ncbi:Zn-ribbon domain-containing OB-fold protein [Gordonia sp. CPCC 206044]|uniref:Zn-ribbon domain-containing OB-fold protein n=1 Tax=Gordonia sp. CPCC 206044 TaxID=3140793 RepID=UPI003AF33EE7
MTRSAVAQGRPAPVINGDTEFFWEAAADRKLVAQCCSACRVLRHPPGPACPQCHSFDWEVVELSGRGTLFSFTVVHHPPVPGFDGPAIVVVVELEEGTRFVSNMTDVDPDTLKIGEPLEVFFVDQVEGWTAPQFRRPAEPSSGVAT